MRLSVSSSGLLVVGTHGPKAKEMMRCDASKCSISGMRNWCMCLPP